MEDIKKEAVEHFQRFMQTKDGNLSEVPQDVLESLLSFKCTANDRSLLAAPVLANEIKSSLQSLPSDKVSGPDGYTKEFFTEAWSVIGNDVITAIQSFFIFGFLPSSINATAITLIPKAENAQTMKDFRPIACCNLLYKVISKILANRLKIILPKAIEPNQCAFIKGRLLMENVLLASELVNGYHKSGASSRSTIKFDIAKAFDTVKWSFITSVLKAMGMPVLFIHWIRLCISSASFSVLINGSLEGFFTSARGIRQGCSLSPYLYGILNNVLSKMLNRAADHGRFDYHPKCHHVKLTHLSFADDILVFTNGTQRSLKGVMEVMKQFADMSGLYINVSKSSIFTTGDNVDNLSPLAAEIGIAMGILPIRYLGLPLTTKALTKLDYEPLIDKIRNKMLGWSNKPLSFAGRLQLLKSVIAGIVNFWTSAFILPAGCLDIIESLCNSFLWSGTPTQTHKAKIAWQDLCYPKSEGGLGLRSLRDSSKVCALQLVWRLFTLSGSLWVAWVKHYLLRGVSFWDVKQTSSGSWIWNKLLKVRELAYNFIKIDVRNGETAFFWYDNWIEDGKLVDVFGDSGTRVLGIEKHARVVDATNAMGWRFRDCRARVHLETVNRLLATPLPDRNDGEDIMLWRHSQDRYRQDFSATSTWNQIRLSKSQVEWEHIVWFNQGTPRFSFITWLALWDRLSTGARMRSWGIHQTCVFCGERDETRTHLFYACPYTYTVWLSIAGGLMGSAINPDWSDTITYMIRVKSPPMDHILLRIAFQTTIYLVWRERNSRRHQRGWVTESQLARMIDKNIRNRISILNYKPPHKYAGLLGRWFSMGIA